MTNQGKQIQLKNPEASATSKQLWLLHILTKQDTRGLTLTIKQASEKITELKGNASQRPLVNPHATALQQDKQLLAQQRYDKHTSNASPEAPQSPQRRNLHYCVMVSVAPSTHHMSNGKHKWRACHISKDIRKATTNYNECVKYLNNQNYGRIKAYVLVECRKAMFARSMLLAGLTEYRGERTGKLYARILKDTRTNNDSLVGHMDAGGSPVLSCET